MRFSALLQLLDQCGQQLDTFLDCNARSAADDALTAVCAAPDPVCYKQLLNAAASVHTAISGAYTEITMSTAVKHTRSDSSYTCAVAHYTQHAAVG
jgi:hypothetical protein